MKVNNARAAGESRKATWCAISGKKPKTQMVTIAKEE